MEGLFSRQPETARRPLAVLPECGRCGLYKGCRTPKMAVAGRGELGILVVGEAPGEQEDFQGIPFVGPAGQLLQRTLRPAGLDLFRDCWVTNALACRPPGNKIPTEQTVEFCRPKVIEAIETLRPTCILLLGARAIRSVLGHVWRADVGDVDRWAGWRIPLRRWNSWIVPTWHPSHILRNRNDRRDPVKETLFAEHVQSVAELARPPWNPVPDADSLCSVILDPAEVAGQLDPVIGPGGEIAFDFETTTLKPDGPKAAIVACSIAANGRSISFPWTGSAITATRRILADPSITKDGWNVKMEDRWCRKVFGFPVAGWRCPAGDGMLNAHTLDNRARDDASDKERYRGRGITSLKFQAFVRLGVEDYSAGISEYLKARGGNDENRIRELTNSPGGLRRLLKYCAYDSLCTADICRIQREEMAR